MYDSLAVVWNACQTAIEQATGKKCSLSESVLEDGCGDIVKDINKGGRRVIQVTMRVYVSFAR